MMQLRVMHSMSRRSTLHLAGRLICLVSFSAAIAEESKALQPTALLRDRNEQLYQIQRGQQ